MIFGVVCFWGLGFWFWGGWGQPGWFYEVDYVEGEHFGRGFAVERWDVVVDGCDDEREKKEGSDLFL